MVVRIQPAATGPGGDPPVGWHLRATLGWPARHARSSDEPGGGAGASTVGVVRGARLLSGDPGRACPCWTGLLEVRRGVGPLGVRRFDRRRDRRRDPDRGPLRWRA